ncbi:hypothetical protein F511_03687 [Dorcoceras hygrometricum]|uniref:Uncharacterized protein n=1 Tax=Dorcoceras hygrometricum TaxID=472368 RepID=A0A2Z7BD50_9LAMI|nr:hypothetical protein F511_03687 [Dorcoceras hygrometricum]
MVTQTKEKRMPTWMDDYVSGEGLSEEEVEAYMVQEVIADYPILFEEVVKHEKRRKAMDSEISSIEKNQNLGAHGPGDEDLFAFTDSDYAGDEADSRSTSGYVFLLSSGAVSWMSKKQPIVTLSTTEAESVADAACASQVVWMRQVLKNLSHNKKSSTTIMCYNSSTIKLSKNPVLHGRCKHIRVRFHFLRNLARDGEIELVHCGTQEQAADLMTKALKIDTFEKHRKKMGMVDVSELN